jgi:hypothetical protein
MRHKSTKVNKNIIYLLRNNLNGKLYIGQTVQGFSERWSKHKNAAFGSRGRSLIHKAIRKYGSENFSSRELATVVSTNPCEWLNILEVFFIKYFNSVHPNGYNLPYGGKNEQRSQKTKQALSKSLRGNTNRVGKHHSEESKEKIRISNTGKRRSLQARLNISKAHIGLPSNWKGRKHSEETRLKMSRDRKGKRIGEKRKPHTAETKALLRSLNLGRVPPNKGVPMSPEQRLKVSIAKKKYFAEKRLREQLDANSKS